MQFVEGFEVGILDRNQEPWIQLCHLCIEIFLSRLNYAKQKYYIMVVSIAGDEKATYRDDEEVYTKGKLLFDLWIYGNPFITGTTFNECQRKCAYMMLESYDHQRIAVRFMKGILFLKKVFVINAAVVHIRSKDRRET